MDTVGHVQEAVLKELGYTGDRDGARMWVKLMNDEEDDEGNAQPAETPDVGAGGGADSEYRLFRTGPKLDEEEVGEHLDDCDVVMALVEVQNPNGTFPRDLLDGEWRSKLVVGDMVDAQDSDKLWFESKIVVADDPDTVKVHFMGWSERWDDTMKRTSTRLQPFHSQVTPWRDLEKEDTVEISDR